MLINLNVEFSNKVVILIGGESAIGLEAAKQFVDQGAKVVINGRDKKTRISFPKNRFHR